jgi:hypothetical protein
MHQPNHFEIYRTSGECCEEHFGGSDTCVAKSDASHAPFPFPIHFPGTDEHRPFAPDEAQDPWGTDASHQPFWFPDLINKLNCVYGNNYENWYQDDGFEAHYLFSNSTACCEQWYPNRGTYCPDYSASVNPEADDEPWHMQPFSTPMKNYYFPDFNMNSCGFGRDYPAWMGYNNYEKHYLFNKGTECCSKYFPLTANCPYEDELQLDYYWTPYEDNIHNLDDMPIIYNHTYYPDLNGGTCVNGTDHPAWMGADKDFKRLYLFKRLDGCCKQWFSDWDLDGCIATVRQGRYQGDVVPCPENRAETIGNVTACNDTLPIVTNITEELMDMYYPDIDAGTCRKDRGMPLWMLVEGYSIWYLFNTREQCCAAFSLC